ncbi:MAG TPA: hypothetical protein VIJ14_01615 [Rhabdochlamydiaceae bacterium]
MTREDRMYMNELSKAAYGSSSRWQKILEKGVTEKYERNHDSVVPSADGKTFEVKTVKIYESRLRRYTETELAATMIGIVENRKEQFSKIMESLQKQTVEPATVSISGIENGAEITMTDSLGNVTTATNVSVPSVQSI